MKRLICLMAVFTLLAGLTACSGNANPVNSGDKAEGSDETSDETSAADAEQLGYVLDDFVGYYSSFYSKASALSTDEFNSVDVVLVTRSDEADTLAYLREAASQPESDLTELCEELLSIYEEIGSFDYSSSQQEHIDFCNRMYSLMERLADYLGEALPEDTLPVATPAPSATQAPAEEGEDGETDGAVISNSRWDGPVPDDDSGQLNGYSIVFYDGMAYFGITYDTDEDIIENGMAASYTVADGEILFETENRPQIARMSYDGETIVDDSEDEAEIVFSAGYVLTKSYDLP